MFFAIQSRKRIGLGQCVCQRCRNVYDICRREMDGDFDDIEESSIAMEQDEESVSMNGDTFG